MAPPTQRNDRKANVKLKRKKARRCGNTDDEEDNNIAAIKPTTRAIVAKKNGISAAIAAQDNIACPPTSVKSRLAAQLVHVIEVLQLRSSWLPFVPSLVGLSATLGM